MKDSSTVPRFRLLVHGQDGSIPYLTPELRSIFFPDETVDNQLLEDGRLHREHTILGLAVKDTCITADYQEPSPKQKKRKGDNDVDAENANDHLAKQARLTDISSAEASSQSSSSDGKDSKSTSKKQQQQQQNKKPTGYSFLNKQKASRICDVIGGPQEHSTASNYMEKYLRTPHHISTLIVPTFSFANDETSANAPESKKYTPKKQETKQPQQKKNNGSNIVIPKSKKDAVSIETPHGWQSIRPEQFCGAVSSMMLASDSNEVTNNCEGVVGLFDHVDLSYMQSDSLFSESSTKEDSESCTTKEQAQKQARKKITASLQKSNDWACRAYQTFMDEAQPSKFWLPVQILASQLPNHVVFTTPNTRPNLQKQCEGREQLFLSNHPNVAIVGWEALVCDNKQRRDVLRNLMGTIQSTSTTPKQFLLLAVNDVQSILDAAKEGISIIGSDMARLRSREGIALCFDFECADGISAKEVDMKDTQFARDFEPILSNCTCIACRSRKSGKSPSFTRAYIHHLIQAKEMLAEILLFAHNLHQLILLFRQLSKAAALDDGKEEQEHLEAFCRSIERSLT